jgi:hypothetical protein
MIDYCRLIQHIDRIQSKQIKLHDAIHSSTSWYNLSRDILIEQIDRYNIGPKVRQISKLDMQEIAGSLLDKVRRTIHVEYARYMRILVVDLVFRCIIIDIVRSTIVSVVFKQANLFDSTMANNLDRSSQSISCHSSCYFSHVHMSNASYSSVISFYWMIIVRPHSNCLSLFMPCSRY